MRKGKWEKAHELTESSSLYVFTCGVSVQTEGLAQARQIPGLSPQPKSCIKEQTQRGEAAQSRSQSDCPKSCHPRVAQKSLGRCKTEVKNRMRSQDESEIDISQQLFTQTHPHLPRSGNQTLAAGSCGWQVSAFNKNMSAGLVGWLSQ